MTWTFRRRCAGAPVTVVCASVLTVALEACGESSPDREEPLATEPPAFDAQVVGECGDGWTDAHEACDDGNLSDGDYCAADCGAVTGSCGDGVWQDNEQCEGPVGYFGMCTADCLPQPGVACSREGGEPSCQTLQLSGLPHESMMSQLLAPDMARFCVWFNSVKGAISAELGQTVVRCSGFNFDYKSDDCSNVTTRGSDTLAAYGLSCDMSVLQFERCFWDSMLRPCKVVRLEQGRVRMASACWSEACASQPRQDAGL